MRSVTKTCSSGKNYTHCKITLWLAGVSLIVAVFVIINFTIVINLSILLFIVHESGKVSKFFLIHSMMKTLCSFSEDIPVFFSVGASQTEHYSPDGILKFHDIISEQNLGFPGWNPSTNMYTCPVTGYYLLIVTLYKGDNNDGNNYNCGFNLRMSSSGAHESVWRLINRNDNDNSVQFSSSVNAIVPCEAGQNLWLISSSPCSIFGSPTFYYQTFTGILLSEADGKKFV